MRAAHRVLAGLAAALVTAGAGACGGGDAAAPVYVTASVDDIIENPAACLDEDVAVRGIVQQLVGPREFTLSGTERGPAAASDDDAGASPQPGGDQILIVATTKVSGEDEPSARGPITEGDVLQVEGRVKALDDLRGDAGEAQGVSFSAVPTIVATEISPSGEQPEDIDEDDDVSPCAASGTQTTGE